VQYVSFHQPPPPTVFMAAQQMPGSIGGLPLDLSPLGNLAQLAPPSAAPWKTST
jgi:hypothetical protein